MSISVFKYCNKIIIVAMLLTSGLWNISAQTAVVSPADALSGDAFGFSENIHIYYIGDEAALYTVYASDFAGNTSDIVSYQTVIDPYNYYLVQNPSEGSAVPNGTKDAPFTNFLQLYARLNNIDTFQSLSVRQTDRLNTAVWLDAVSRVSVDSDNSYIGFSTLFADL